MALRVDSSSRTDTGYSRGAEVAQVLTPARLNRRPIFGPFQGHKAPRKSVFRGLKVELERVQVWRAIALHGNIDFDIPGSVTF